MMGSFEGKNIFNADKDKGIINNIIYDKINPNLRCDIEFIPCDESNWFLFS